MPVPIGMGLHPLLQKGGGPRKNRWVFSIEPYIGKEVGMLPPTKGARPNLSFKEFSAEHLNETIYFPGKVEWSTLDVSLYDIGHHDNIIYRWVQKIYDPEGVKGKKKSFFNPSLGVQGLRNYKLDATLTLYNGCGYALEEWTYKNAFPIKIDWGELDMTVSDLVMVDLTLRYDRAYYNNRACLQSPGRTVLPTQAPQALQDDGGQALTTPMIVR